METESELSLERRRRDADNQAAQYEIETLKEELERLRAAMHEACDLLAERTHGNSARSAGHNARLRLETALKTT